MGKFKGVKWDIEEYHEEDLIGLSVSDNKNGLILYDTGLKGCIYEEEERNAKLIAAAPEMLEALIRIEDYVSRSLTLSGHSKKDIEIILSKVRTSIKKATE